MNDFPLRKSSNLYQRMLLFIILNRMPFIILHDAKYSTNILHDISIYCITLNSLSADKFPFTERWVGVLKMNRLKWRINIFELLFIDSGVRTRKNLTKFRRFRTASLLIQQKYNPCIRNINIFRSKRKNWSYDVEVWQQKCVRLWWEWAALRNCCELRTESANFVFSLWVLWF